MARKAVSGTELQPKAHSRIDLACGGTLRPDKIRRVAVVGAGIMGHGFAQLFAQKGYAVSLQDLDRGILNDAIRQISRNLDTLRRHGLFLKTSKKEVLGNISLTLDLSKAVATADFVLEAVPEILDLKKEVFQRIDRFAPRHAIVASNTSGLRITDIGSATHRPSKTIIVHGANPPHLIPIVEIVRGETTSDETAEVTYRLMLKLGKIPVRLLREVPGFLFNRLQFALYREALHCLEIGVATAEDIDLVVKAGFGFRLPVLGPLETSDFGGLDTFFRISKNIFPDLDDSKTPPRTLVRMIEEGKLGVKSGEGFYKYPASTVRKRIRKRDEKLIEQLKTLYPSAGRRTS
jgi:3-hydroxybutyryl-CoA dehydrogenase